MNRNPIAEGPSNNSPMVSTRQALHYVARIARLLRPYWPSLLKSVVFSSVLGLLAMLGPYFMKVLIDRVYPTRDIGLMEMLVLAVLVLGVSTTIMGAINSYFTQVIGAELGASMNLMFFNHVQHLPASFFDGHSVGEVLSRFGDTRIALGTVTSAFQTIVSSGVYLIIVPPFLLLLNWKLTVLSVIVIPITTTVATVASRATRRYYKRAAEAGAELNAYQLEALSHIRTLKSMAREPHVFARVRHESQSLLTASLEASRLQTAVGVCNSIIRAAGTALFTWYGWTLILHNELTLGGFMAFSAYVGYLTNPVTQIASLFASAQQMTVSMGRMFEYLDTPPEQDPAVSFELPALRKRNPSVTVTLSNVTFGYGNGEPVFSNVSADFAAGTTTAILGESGAGKSSLLKLIPRLADPDDGEVWVGGVSVNNIALPDLRNQVAVVWQDVSLMRGSILDNLTLGSEVRRSILDDAISVCGLDDLLSKVSHGLDSTIGEFGAKLSGGQKQRIAIARAIIRGTPILLLDEATSNIDVVGEELLLSQLMTHYRDRTIVLVTHRVAVTKNVDQVCILSHGQLVAAGTPESVYRECAVYREMRDGADPKRARPLAVS